MVILGTEKYLHHPESKKRKSSEANSGSIHPYGRYENAVKTRKTHISTIAILWPVEAIFEKRAATVEVDTLISPVFNFELITYPLHYINCLRSNFGIMTGHTVSKRPQA